MPATMPKIQTLVLAQTALTRIDMRCRATQASYTALALVLGLIAVGMLNVAAFLGLSQVVEAAWAALILSAFDTLVAVLLIQAASRVRPGPEAQIAKEVRDIMLDELSAEAQSVRDEIEGVRADVQRIRSGFSAFSGGLPGIGQIVELLTKALGRPKKKGSR